MKRPRFVKVGQASVGAQSLLAAALHRTGEKRFLAEASRMVMKLKALPHPAVALALSQQKDPAAGQVITRFNELYFDAASGAYMTTPAQLPPGIAVRVPALGETPSAEVLALLAGVDAKTADLIRRNLFTQIEYDELPPGDILIGLSQAQK